MRILSIIFLSLLISSCSGGMKRKIGLETPAPNEYEARRRDSLEVPPSYDLPSPKNDSAEDPRVQDNQNGEQVDQEIESLLNDMNM